MITLTLSAVIRDVTVEIQGEANTLQEISDAWTSFLEAAHYIDTGVEPRSFSDLDITRQNLTRPTGDIQEVL